MQVVVDYARTLQDLLDEAGFGWRAPARLGVFGTGSHALTAEVITLVDDTPTPRALAALGERGLRPATVFELAAAAVADRALGARDVVVALGSCDVNHVGGPACPAIAAFEGTRQIVMTGFTRAWPAGTVLLGIPASLEAGHGKVSHNHLFPIEARRSPKLVFGQPPCLVTYEVPYDGAIDLRTAAKRAKLRNVSPMADDLPPPSPGARTLSMTVIDFNRQLRTPEVVAALAARRLRPATADELVALVAAHPDAIAERQIWAPTARAGVYSKTLGVDVNAPDSPWPFGHSFAGVR